MKESYSICFTSHDEVMFRDEADHGMFVNIMAIEAYRTGSEILSDAEMSTHVHMNAFTRQPTMFAGRTRMSYTKYFNGKYGRKGRMGEKGTYVLLVNGFNHQLVLNNYIFRNGLHHGAAATAFGYPYSSIREMFAGDLGWVLPSAEYTRREDIVPFLPRFADFPDSYQMDGNGVFLRRSFMEIRKVEMFYTSPRNFLYQMNRLTDESWEEDQKKDRPEGPYRDALGHPLLSQEEIGAPNIVIDPDVFRDPATGKYYLYWGNSYLWMAELAEDMVSLVPGTMHELIPRERIGEYHYLEGTYVFERNGLYYFMWSENITRSARYCVRYLISDSPTAFVRNGQPARVEEQIILQQDPSLQIFGTGHNSVLNIPGTDDWYMVYHRFTRPEGIKMGLSGGYNREVCIDPMYFNPDGTIIPVHPTL